MSPLSPKQAEQASREVQPRTAAGIDARQLFDSHLAFVWRNLRRLGVPESLVEDAAQDVFLVVHRRWDTWKAELSTVETWLFGILLRVARNYRRAQQRRLAWLLPAAGPKTMQEAPALTDGPAEILAQREAARLFERALAPLDEAKRSVFLLVDLEQMTVPQAASTLGINTNTAYWRLRQARLAFRSALLRLRAQDDEAHRDEAHRRSRP
jgi:RNA polymerase sigma-70 factor (ECF subfamily)